MPELSFATLPFVLALLVPAVLAGEDDAPGLAGLGQTHRPDALT